MGSFRVKDKINKRGIEMRGLVEFTNANELFDLKLKKFSLINRTDLKVLTMFSQRGHKFSRK